MMMIFGVERDYGSRVWLGNHRLSFYRASKYLRGETTSSRKEKNLGRATVAKVERVVVGQEAFAFSYVLILTASFD